MISTGKDVGAASSIKMFSVPSVHGVVSLLNAAEKPIGGKKSCSSRSNTQKPLFRLKGGSKDTTESSTAADNDQKHLCLSHALIANKTDSGGSGTSIQPASYVSSCDEYIEPSKRPQGSGNVGRKQNAPGTTEQEENGYFSMPNYIDKRKRDEDDLYHNEQGHSHKTIKSTNVEFATILLALSSPNEPPNLPSLKAKATQKADEEEYTHTSVCSDLNDSDPKISSVAKVNIGTCGEQKGLPTCQGNVIRQEIKERYPCTFLGCGKTLSTTGHLARHNRIHTGYKPYRCTFPECHSRFSRQDNSLQHYRSHCFYPKSRNTNRAEKLSGITLSDNELRVYPPEGKSNVYMGRQALKDGKAIAVVKEHQDEIGRRVELVHRMVGQANGG